LADQDWIGLAIFKNFADQDWIGFNFIGSGLDADWTISQSAHLWAIPHLYKQERIRPTSVERRLIRTHAVLGRAISGGWVPVLGMKVRSLVGLSNHSTFHWRSAHCAPRMLLLSDELMSCCVVGTEMSASNAPCIRTQWTGEC